MTNPKRASMREGPLAALFRKTEADEPAQAGAEAEAAPSRSQTTAGRDERRAPARERGVAKDATLEREAPGPAEQAPRRSRERGAPIRH